MAKRAYHFLKRLVGGGGSANTAPAMFQQLD
jgi:hypothetical protein